ncbi:MAG TPA: sugar phosphate isomerase/epimerase [Candidatus Sphingobacterium stercoripullorum]|uniref:Sugar phosphate isomerase/epimerase n=1 Tax=Candidatus Sphingobacterium stercoripullorum TaxID=2838759 RepID=A0A9D1W8T1_9SPHI|nr:sugar phosphate isomerase/epimerase [Candidatus Sphingobacterium stercoripullorum]
MMESRRSFIKTFSIGIGAALLSSHLISCSSNEAESPFHQIGLQLYTLRDLMAKEPEATLEAIAQIGFKHVETFGYENGKFWGFTAEEFKKLLDNLGLKSYSGHYDLANHLDSNATDKENLEQYIEAAHILGQKYITAPVSPMHSIIELDSPDYQYMAEQLNKAGEMTQRANIQMAYHNHFWELRNFANGTRGLDVLLAFTEPELVSFELDIFWLEKAGYSARSYFQKYPGRFHLWHVKDMDRGHQETINDDAYKDAETLAKVNEKVRFTEVGSGAIDYPNIVAQAHQSGLKYAYIEQDQIYMDNKFSSVKKSYDYVRKQLTQNLI